MQLDIVIDRSGYTAIHAPLSLPIGRAPIQVNYIGYPGYARGGFYDYVIADPTSCRSISSRSTAGKIVHLPESYLVNDTKRLTRWI